MGCHNEYYTTSKSVADQGNLCNYQLTNTSLPFEKLDLDIFFPKSRVLIHFPGDLPIARRRYNENNKGGTSLPALFHMITA